MIIIEKNSFYRKKNIKKKNSDSWSYSKKYIHTYMNEE